MKREDIPVSAILFLIMLLMGLAVGSFLNVCIYRIPEGESIFFPGSRCPHCGKKIRFYDNIPVLSFIILKGKCRSCNSRISIQYPVVELLTSFLFLAAYWWHGLSLGFVSTIVLGGLLIIVFFVDLKHRMIPDVITIPGILAGLFLALFSPQIKMVDAVLGLVVGGGVFYLLAIFGELLFKKESMGGGDIKLAAMLGAFLGWQKLFLIFFLSAFLGSVVGILAIHLSSKVKEHRTIPFGPFLALASFAALFWGEGLINAYLSIFSGL
jgi:leader peptidase (prepilin peptidase)/N-methyltransferase